MSTPYEPGGSPTCTFHAARARFLTGDDTPADFLDRCLGVIAAREPQVKAWVTLNEAGARAAAAESSERYRAGKPLLRR